MIKNYKIIFSLFISIILISSNQNSEESPNIILILSDDQGWSGMFKCLKT